jgi:hypothetical protein
MKGRTKVGHKIVTCTAYDLSKWQGASTLQACTARCNMNYLICWTFFAISISTVPPPTVNHFHGHVLPTSRDTCVSDPASVLRLQSCDYANPQERYISTAAKLNSALPTGHTLAGNIRFDAIIIPPLFPSFSLQPWVLGDQQSLWPINPLPS